MAVPAEVSQRRVLVGAAIVAPIAAAGVMWWHVGRVSEGDFLAPMSHGRAIAERVIGIFSLTLLVLALALLIAASAKGWLRGRWWLVLALLLFAGVLLGDAVRWAAADPIDTDGPFVVPLELAFVFGVLTWAAVFTTAWHRPQQAPSAAMTPETRRRRDLSWPLGWAAVIIVCAAGIPLCIGWNMGDNFDAQQRYYVDAVAVWLLGAHTVVVAVLVAVVASPKGRGWRPALGALALMAVLLVLALHAPVTSSGD